MIIITIMTILYSELLVVIFLNSSRPRTHEGAGKPFSRGADLLVVLLRAGDYQPLQALETAAAGRRAGAIIMMIVSGSYDTACSS